MNFEKIAEEFVNKVMSENPNYSKEELLEVLKEVEPVLLANKDKTLEEVVCELLPSLITSAEDILKKYPVPGYVLQNSSGLVNITAYSGHIDDKGNPMRKDAIFDLASITKLFTQIISYNLIKEGYYSFDSIVKDLDPRYVNADNLDIKTIMEFAFSYNISGNINNAQSVEEARNILHTLGVRDKGSYNYIDFGMMCLKDVMETVTGLSYEELLKKYVTSKLHLSSTFLNIPEDKKILLTGTPNRDIGKNNDLKAIKLGGFGGHAGVLSSSNDLLKVVQNLYVNPDFFPSEYLYHTYMESEISKQKDEQRGIMGNACASVGAFIDRLSSKNESAYQGSTRTQANVSTINGYLNASTILLNPSSMGIEKARELEKEYEKRFITEYNFEGQDYVQMASQLILPARKVVGPLTHEIAKLKIKLSFLNTLVDCYEPNYDKEIDIEIENGKLKR